MGKREDKRIGKEHREIYLNNANRTEKADLKNILRYIVSNIGKYFATDTIKQA